MEYLVGMALVAAIGYFVFGGKKAEQTTDDSAQAPYKVEPPAPAPAVEVVAESPKAKKAPAKKPAAKKPAAAKAPAKKAPAKKPAKAKAAK